MEEKLRTNRDALLGQYNDNLAATRDIQHTLVHDVLPSVVDELALDRDAQQWAKDFLLDTPSIFRISRRNKFTRSFCLEAVRKNLLWRLTHLWPPKTPIPIPNLHCLPPDVRDQFGRPILLLDTAPFDIDADTHKQLILQGFEHLRAYLQKLYDDSETPEDPPLQYIVLFDLRNLALQYLNIDLFSWTIREVIPRFPGMLAGVLMVNYSWTHAGVWGLVKRVLPESALSRVFFPSNSELLYYFSPAVLPRELGGSLPPLSTLHDPIQPKTIQSDESPLIIQEPARDSAPAPPPVSWLSSTSILNPFFGYPVLASASQPPSFKHGRRRKRDLARTLAILFWLRWRTHITATAVLAIISLLAGFGIRRGWLRFVGLRRLLGFRR